MPSYKQAIGDHVNPVIFERGIKYYLEGNVLSHKPSILGGWREYEVKGSSEEYYVTIPLVFDLIDPVNHNQAGSILQKHTQCTCPYNIDHGVCKHIVAVCCAIDSENKTEPVYTKPKSVLDNFFGTQMVEQTNIYHSAMIHYLELRDDEDPGNISLKQAYDAINTMRSVEAELSVIEHLHPYCSEHWTSYQLHKRISKLAQFSRVYPVASDELWTWLTTWVAKLEYDLLIPTASELFKDVIIYKKTLSQPVWEVIIEMYREMGELVWNKIIQYLDSTKTNLAVRVEFALAVQYWSWLLSHLVELDLATLLYLLSETPEHSDDLEPLIDHQISMLSDFLSPKLEGELVTAMKRWRVTSPDSELLEYRKKQLMDQHKRKSKLLSLLKKI